MESSIASRNRILSLWMMKFVRRILGGDSERAGGEGIVGQRFV